MSERDAQCAAWNHRDFATIWKHLSQDVDRFLHRALEDQSSAAAIRHRLSAYLKPQFSSLLLYRVSHFLSVRKWRRAAAIISYANAIVHRSRVTADSCIGPGCFMPHPAGLTFCGTAGRNLTMYALSVCCPTDISLDAAAANGPQLGNDVTVGGHAVVVGNVVIGDDTKIAPGIRVGRDTPAGMIVVSRLFRPKMTAR